MNSNIHKNENDDVSQRFQSFKTEQFKEEHINLDNMITTTWEKSPIRRLNFISGPQSAFARLFPDKYRQQEEFINQQRSKPCDIQHTISDDDDHDDHDREELKKSRRVRFYTNEDDSIKIHAKSEPCLNQIHLDNDINYDPNPEIIYHDNPDNIIYTQKVGVRYLKPPTPPPPGPILIREIQSTPPNAPPPFVVSTTP